MRRRFLALVAAILLLPVWAASAEEYITMSIGATELSAGETVRVYFTAPKAGKVTLTAIDASGQVCATLLDNSKIEKGTHDLLWDGKENGQALPAGAYVLHLTLEDMTVEMDLAILPGEGAATEAQAERVSIPMTPAYKSQHTPSPAHEACYWCTPMDIHDEAAIWAMLMAPITVVKGDGPKKQVILREEPSDDAKGVGVVTCLSQSVHVLETRDDGWSLIECYSSSFHDSKVKAWNLFVTGYIPTNKLTQKKPAQDYGIVIDKLTQELYLFKEGRLFSRLLVSTGLYNDKQPYNETRSGEFLIISEPVDIRSDKMIGSMALRFNSGDLLHEVPHVKNADGTKNFESTEYKLGTRASHGCIRTQRLKNAEGVNMAYLRNNLSMYTKIAIWEDYQGRYIDSPDASTPLYFNTNKGTSYHSTPQCNGVRKEYLPLTGVFTFGQLEDADYKDLTKCPSCNPPRRLAEIAEINAAHETQSPGQVPQHLRQDK